jgi:uncharacterized protein YggU (UPF0235/DUF167 family)
LEGGQVSKIYFRVNPGETEFSIENGSIPEVSLTEKAENGRANTELKKKLEQITGERPGIISGAKSKRKKLVFDQDEEEVKTKIGEFLDGKKQEVQN